MQVRLPRSFAADLDRAAMKRFMSRSVFVRAALADKLKADRLENEAVA
jgi:metal-responsive CopG/Arc/MetJ family transcriptional regulator